MSYTQTFSLQLGATRAGLELTAVLLSSDRTVVNTINTGAIDLGGGMYDWALTLPDGFRGWVHFKSGATLLLGAAINPEEAELVGKALPAALPGTADGLARTQDVQPTITVNAPDVTVNPTLTVEQAAQLSSAADGVEILLSQSSGVGDTPVNHNTGGADNLRAVDANGNGVDGVTIRAYLKSEYDAGGRIIRGQAVTGPDGRWLTDMMLNTGYTYTFVFSKPEAIQDSHVDQAV